MSRRKQQVRVSLFAFQDIITSVMGILILVVLLLSVIVSQTIENQEQSKTETASDVGPTNQEMEQLRKQVASMQAQLDGSIEMLNELSSLESEYQLQQKIKEQQARLDTLNRAVSDARSTVRQLESEVTVEEGKLAAMSRDLGLKDLEDHRDQLQSEIELLTSNRRIMFNFRNLSGKTPWIVDISKDGLLIAELGVERGPMSVDKASERETVREFEKWLESKNAATTHIVLAVKPNSNSLYREVKELIENSGTSVGVELLPQDVQIIDRSKGATL